MRRHLTRWPRRRPARMLGGIGVPARHHGYELTLRDTNLDPHSWDHSLASKGAAAFAASNVSVVPSTTRSLRLPLLELALRRTSHVGTPSCVNYFYFPSVECLLGVQHP